MYKLKFSLRYKKAVKAVKVTLLFIKKLKPLKINDIMGQVVIGYCNKCKGLVKLEWRVDRDSDPSEPQFYQICQKCAEIDDFFTPINKDDKKLEDFL